MESHQSQCQIKIKIFRSNVLSILLYGAECWKTTVAIQQKVEVFQTKCLQHILKIYWPNTISNEKLRNRTGMDTLAEILQTRQWRWLGHVSRMPSITRTALRAKERPRETWRCTVKKNHNVRDCVSIWHREQQQSMPDGA